MSRIDDLINTVPTDTSGRWVNVKDLPALVESVVRECARVYWNIDQSETHTEYVNDLKNHFGVE